MDDAVLKKIWRTGMEESQAERIAQPLVDSIGPRLAGSPAHEAAHDWAVRLIESWGIAARKDVYGTTPSHYPGWTRGITHIDLLQPRVRSLEGAMAAWSPRTNGPVEGPVAVFPEDRDPAELEDWLRTLRGKFVAISFPQPTCRPDSHYSEFGTPGALDRLRAAREEALRAFQQRVPPSPFVRIRLEEAGALGILESTGNHDIGVNGVLVTNTSRTPTINLSCEDYGLVYRLAANNQGPVVRVNAESAHLGEVPVHNTIAELPGRELADEYVVLSAHMDSWDAASGATDNATGVTVMLEALRILRQAYPNPKRTIILGLWGGEEVGPWGSTRFVAQHPRIVENLQVLFNQDSGTGRIVEISAHGFVGAAPHLANWVAQVPEEISRHVSLTLPGLPLAGGSDHLAFICAGAPGLNLRSAPWSYDLHTWHTNRDTYDKIVFEEIRSNAVLVAMLVYLASEAPDRVSRERRVMPQNTQGQPEPWPSCSAGPPGVIAVAEIMSGGSLRSDGRGPYIDNAAGVVTRVGPYPLLLCTQRPCASGAFPRLAPPQEAQRGVVLDLSDPIQSSGAVNRGVVASPAALFTAFWNQQPVMQSVHDLPLDSSAVSERLEIRFMLDGAQHVLQFGPWSEGALTGEGTTAAILTRVSPTRFSVRSPSASVGRLWDNRDPANPKDLGLYRFSYEVLFRVPPGY